MINCKECKDVGDRCRRSLRCLPEIMTPSATSDDEDDAVAESDVAMLSSRMMVDCQVDCLVVFLARRFSLPRDQGTDGRLSGGSPVCASMAGRTARCLERNDACKDNHTLLDGVLLALKLKLRELLTFQGLRLIGG